MVGTNPIYSTTHPCACSARVLADVRDVDQCDDAAATRSTTGGPSCSTPRCCSWSRSTSIRYQHAYPLRDALELSPMETYETRGVVQAHGASRNSNHSRIQLEPRRERALA
jgi:hypothetical protein